MLTATRFSFLACAAALTAAPLSSATTLATASYDADSYVFAKSNNAASTEISISQDTSAFSYHFNFGVIEFADLGSAAPGGPTYLQLDLKSFITSSFDEETGNVTQQLSQTGSAELKIVALESAYTNYLALPAFGAPGTTLASDWYDDYVGSADADASATIDQAGLHHIDITSIVDGWIADPNSNLGLTLVVTSGDELEFGANEGGGGPMLTSSVPEPGSLALLGVAAVSLLRRRR